MSEKQLRYGSVVISKSGHDKGTYFAVVGFSDDRVLVADGDKRKICKPKKKNPAHIHYFGADIDSRETGLSDAVLRRILKEFAAQRKDS